MTALTADRQTKSRTGDDPHPVAASTDIYKGSIVCVNAAGNAIPGADAADNQVVGIAAEQSLNTSGAAGDKTVAVSSGRAFLLAASGMTLANVGDTVYVLDDQTVTTTIGNGVRAGRIVGFESPIAVWVFIPKGGMVTGAFGATYTATEQGLANKLVS